MMSKYVVTGGAGFIGSNIVETLINRGDDVVVLDDLSTGRRSNAAAWEGRCRFIEGSIVDLEACRNAVEGAEFVLHQAALPSVPRSIADPLRSNAVNVTGTLNMLVAARDAGVKRFILAASSSAYGDTTVLPKREDMPASPLSPYAVAKLTGEHYCRIFHSLYGLETVALRYFNVFGPRQDPQSQYAAVIPKFITAFMANEPPIIYGDGEQTRDFTFVENVVAANIRACEASCTVAGEVINVACGERISLNQLATSIRAMLGAAVGPRYEPARPGDVRDSQADISKARLLLGFAPRVSFSEGLKRTIEWYRRA